MNHSGPKTPCILFQCNAWAIALACAFSWSRWGPTRGSRVQEHCPGESRAASRATHRNAHRQGQALRQQLYRVEGALAHTANRHAPVLPVIGKSLKFLNFSFLIIKWGQVMSHQIVVRTKLTVKSFLKCLVIENCNFLRLPRCWQWNDCSQWTQVPLKELVSPKGGLGQRNLQSNEVSSGTAVITSHVCDALS